MTPFQFYARIAASTMAGAAIGAWVGGSFAAVALGLVGAYAGVLCQIYNLTDRGHGFLGS